MNQRVPPRGREGSPWQGELLERDVEVARIAGFIDRVTAGAGGLMVVEGEAGIGKSSLLARAHRLFEEAGATVLTARGSELERHHPFGLMATVMGPLLKEDQAELFVGPAAAARDILVPDGEGQERELQASMHALSWLIVNLAERGAVAIIVDDVHWADEASLGFLTYLTHRIDDLRVAVVVALRPAEGAQSLAAEHLRSHALATRLTPRPLSTAAVERLVARAGTPAEHTPDPAGLWKSTGGNPFYIVEMLRDAAAGREPEMADSDEAIPDAIRTSIRRRLRGAGEEATRIAEAIAVLDEEATVPLAATLAGVREEDAVEAIRVMAQKSLLESDRLGFVHPIAREAIYDGMPEVVRSGLHARAAALLAQAAAPPASVATQLLRATPAGDAVTVTALRDAARSALGQGDASAAVTYLGRALEEPPPRTERGAVLLDLARAEAASGVPTAADRFAEALKVLPRRRDRAAARLSQGHALVAASRWPEAARAFRTGMDETDADDLELRSRLEAGFVSSAFVGMVEPAEANDRLQSILAAPLRDPGHRELAAWSAFQSTMVARGPSSEAAHLARRAIAGASLEELMRAGQTVELVAGVLLSGDELAQDLALLTRAIEEARRLGLFGKVAVFSYCRSLPHLLGGRISDAVADADAAMSAHELGWSVFYPATCSSMAWARLERGEVDAAEQVLDIDDERWASGLDYQFMVRIGRGRVRMARGDLDGASAQFELARDAGEALGIDSPTVLGDWRTWYALTLRGRGRRAEAGRVAEDAAEIADRWGAPAARASARRVVGVVEGGSAGLAELERARDLVEESAVLLERLRVSLDLGAALRRAGRTGEARDELRRGADIAHRTGATALLERAREELLATGARPRRYAVTGIEALTPSEFRIARMAAQGTRNREIAEALFVTPKAVEYHLANTYRKLGISRRTELAAAVYADQAAASG